MDDLALARMVSVRTFTLSYEKTGSDPVSSAVALERGALQAALQLRLQAEDRLGVELGDPRLGDAQHLADLAQRQLLVVVEGDDSALALRELRNRGGQRLAHLGARHLQRRVVGVGI